MPDQSTASTGVLTRPQPKPAKPFPLTAPRRPTHLTPVPAAGRTTLRRALLVENVHSDASTALTDAGYTVEHLTGAISEDELIARLNGVEVLGIRSGTRITERVLASAGQLEAIGAFCIGTNQIDLAAATRHGVAVFNAPYSNTRSVVELAIGHIFSLSRRVPERNAEMHAGRWHKTAAGSHEVRGRTLGIVGYGNIGSQLSVVAEALGMTVLFHDLADRLPLGNARACSSLHELLTQADIVSVHVDGRSANTDLIGDPELATMQEGSLLVNLSRGTVVDLAALRRHLQSGHLAGAAVDVYPTEPARAGEPFESELRGLPNVILTPHIGGSTTEAQQDIARFVGRKLAEYRRTGSTAMSVNLPQADLARTPGTARLRLLHRHAPGVLEQITQLLAQHDAHLHVHEHAMHDGAGYLLGDIHTDRPSAVILTLRALPAAIRVEVQS